MLADVRRSLGRRRVIDRRQGARVSVRQGAGGTAPRRTARATQSSREAPADMRLRLSSHAPLVAQGGAHSRSCTSLGIRERRQKPPGRQARLPRPGVAMAAEARRALAAGPRCIRQGGGGFALGRNASGAQPSGDQARRACRPARGPRLRDAAFFQLPAGRVGGLYPATLFATCLSPGAAARVVSTRLHRERGAGPSATAHHRRQSCPDPVQLPAPAAPCDSPWRAAPCCAPDRVPHPAAPAQFAGSASGRRRPVTCELST
ncbi:hypothetical protein C8N33_11393 [Pararhodobacter aggregans]|nr:hypothetical protein C8N33_11393 [Pararhodobacter aggregans]